MLFADISRNIEARIRSKNPDIKHIADIVELANIVDETRAWTNYSHLMPAVYIFPESNNATPNNNIGQHCQTINSYIGILIVISALNIREEASSLVSEKLDQISSDLVSSLMGFNPLEGIRSSSSLNYVSGKLHDFQNGLIFWKQTYSLSSIISSGK